MSSASSLFPQFPLEDYLAHKPEIDAALHDMLANGHYILGGEVEAFEKEFAAFAGTRHAVGVANGTDALEIILRALDIGAGAGVAVPSHTAVATASAISRAGAAPVFVDVDPQTFTLCPRALRHTLSSSRGRNLRAVIAVHLYGHPAAWDELQRVADEFSLPLIEDCAQAHGAAHHGRPVGGLGRAAAFSFYPTKNLGAIGDGGAVTTDDADLAERIRIIRQYGWRQRYISEREGINSRLDEMQAAILRVKLRTLHQRLASRRELASRYKHHLGACSHAAAPLVREGCVHAYHLYVIRSPHRDALMRHLTAAGIPVALHYPAAVHQQPAYAGGFAASSPLTNTDQTISEILTLPLHPYLTAAAVDATCAAIASFKP